TDYAAGLTDVRAGTPAPLVGVHVAYTAARTDYTTGLTDVRAGTPAPLAPHDAYTVARADYAAGVADASNRLAAANARVAYVAGHADYLAGWGDRAGGALIPNAAHTAYMTAWNNYGQG